MCILIALLIGLLVIDAIKIFLNELLEFVGFAKHIEFLIYFVCLLVDLCNGVDDLCEQGHREDPGQPNDDDFTHQGDALAGAVMDALAEVVGEEVVYAKEIVGVHVVGVFVDLDGVVEVGQIVVGDDLVEVSKFVDELLAVGHRTLFFVAVDALDC
jgi:hypothetical protein